MAAAKAGYHGSLASLAVDDTYETLFDKASVAGRGKIFGVRLSCVGSNASVLIGPISKYADKTDNPVVIIAGAAPVEFFVEGIGDIRAKQPTVVSDTISWSTIGA